MEVIYKPNPHSKPIVLPPVPPSVSLAPNRAPTGVRQWLTGTRSVLIDRFSPEARQIVNKRWNVKWEYYQQTYEASGVENPDALLESLHEEGLVDHVKRLQLEFTRLLGRLMEIDSNNAFAELSCGVQFVSSLIEEQTPTIVNLQIPNVNRTAKQIEVLKQEVKTVNRVYGFALQAVDAIHRMKLHQVMTSHGANIAPYNPSQSEDLEAGTQNLSSHDSSHSHHLSNRSTPELPTSPDGQNAAETENQVSSGYDGDIVYPPSGSNFTPFPPASTTTQNGDINTKPPKPQHATSLHWQAPTLQQIDTQNHANNQGQILPPPAPTQALSTASAHRMNLVTLSAVSFFGAGMAWVTVFSGTRGNIVVIAWAACCFIVGAVSAVSATSLLDVDGELLNRYSTVRWTVRFLALFSALHVLVGVMLVSAAILVLDPNASGPSAGMNRSKGFTARNSQVAGGYALVVCIFTIAVAFFVRYRHSQRTWFV